MSPLQNYVPPVIGTYRAQQGAGQVRTAVNALPYLYADGVAGMMIDSPDQAISERRRHNRMLLLIAAYKVLQALLFAAIGVGALHLLHRDIADDLATLADHLRFNPESRFVNFVLDKASLVNDPLLRRIGLAALAYAGIGLAEGIGLYLEKAWGEYLTLVITASFLPWEAFEIFHKVTWFRILLLAINALVLLYLAKVVTEQAKTRRMIRTEEAEAD